MHVRCQARYLLHSVSSSDDNCRINPIEKVNVLLIATSSWFPGCKIADLIVFSFNGMMAFPPFNSIFYFPGTCHLKKRGKLNCGNVLWDSIHCHLFKDPWNLINNHLVIFFLFLMRAGYIEECFSFSDSAWKFALLTYFVVTSQFWV